VALEESREPPAIAISFVDKTVDSENLGIKKQLSEPMELSPINKAPA